MSLVDLYEQSWHAGLAEPLNAGQGLFKIFEQIGQRLEPD